MKVLEISSLEECFNEKEVDKYPFTETWEKASKDPIAVLHTSGSTGVPKPIVITHEHMAAVDKYHFLPPVDGQDTSTSLYENRRVLSFMPPFHVSLFDPDILLRVIPLE